VKGEIHSVSGSAAMAVERISVVVADNHPITLDGVGFLLEGEGFDVVARCRSGEECLRALHAQHPDILVLELRLAGKDGLAVLREVKRVSPATQVVLLTSAPEDDQMVEAIRLGVRGVVLKEMPSHLLVECLRKVHVGERWVEKRSSGRLLEKLIHREAATRQLALDLTARELAVLRLVAAGLRNKDIATRLFLTEGTVKVHLHNIFRKLNVKDRYALGLFAHQKGFV
jgi:DNA-binding NarL/FixJ family response regulator